MRFQFRLNILDLFLFVMESYVRCVKGPAMLFDVNWSTALQTPTHPMELRASISIDTWFYNYFLDCVHDQPEIGGSHLHRI